MKIAVAMSGGVDSSAAAAILKEQGHELVGFTMQLWDQRRGINVDENGDPVAGVEGGWRFTLDAVALRPTLKL